MEKEENRDISLLLLSIGKYKDYSYSLEMRFNINVKAYQFSYLVNLKKSCCMFDGFHYIGSYHTDMAAAGSDATISFDDKAL